MNKIFCLGFHKTATVSLSHALQELGFITRHGYKKHSDMILDALYHGLPPLTQLEANYGEYDAYLDLYAVRWFYPKFDKAYPDSKFILTTRDDDEWLASVHRQMKKRPQKESPFFHYWYHQTDTQRLEEKINTERQIRNYFKGRQKDLLEIDITKNSDIQNWGALAYFLNKDVPNKSFPHKNKSPQS